jgi:hypothetical protein
MSNAWIHVYRTVDPTQTSDLSWSIATDSQLTGIVGYAQPAAMPRPARVTLERIHPSVSGTGSDWIRFRPDAPADFDFRAVTILDSDGIFTFKNLPAGNYAVYAPRTNNARGMFPGLFPTEIVSITSNVSRIININPTNMAPTSPLDAN